MNSSLKARFARLGPIRDVDRVSSGSPATFVLRLSESEGTLRSVDATLALARCGMTMLRAKRAIENLIRKSKVFVSLPVVDDPDRLIKELRAAGIAAAPVSPTPDVDIRKLRERLGLTREEFALHFGFELESLRNWEAGRRQPDTAAKSYLRAIENAPEAVAEAYAPAMLHR